MTRRRRPPLEPAAIIAAAALDLCIREDGRLRVGLGDVVLSGA